jgi:uncharacterized protein YeaO (DUF488 family)
VIRTKRVYDPPSRDDGYRLLVMRLWPRGVRKDAVDAWHKDLAPSVELLRGYQSGEVDWREFARRYRAEMRGQRELIGELSRRAKRRTVTLLCGCKDESRCHRTLLKKLVES